MLLVSDGMTNQVIVPYCQVELPAMRIIVNTRPTR